MMFKLLLSAVILIMTALLIKSFPSLFWKKHAGDTRALQAVKYPGINDLEYEYSQDEYTPVEKIRMESDVVYTIYYPQAMLQNQEIYPVVVWGNGTGNTCINYEAGLISLASYGFIVIGCDDSNMGDGRVLYEAGLFAKKLNHDKNSIFLNRMDEKHFGVGGHSQGACGAVNAAAKYPQSRTLFQSLYTTSMPKIEMCKDSDRYHFACWKYDVSLISVPYFSTTGTRFLDSLWISPVTSMRSNFSHLGNIEAYMARQKHANHNIVNEYHGAGYFNAWFCYTLKGDQHAADIFINRQELKTNTKRWQDFAVHKTS